MRGLVTVLLAGHGLIHLIGVAKWWRLAPVPQLSERTLVPLPEGGARVLGAAWLLAAVLLLAAAVLRLLDRDGWWTAAVPALLLSQALVILQWHDAWAGTIPNAVLALVTVAGMSVAQFHRESDARARTLLHQVAPAALASAPLLRSEDIAALPPPVRRWLERSGAVGRPRARTVRLRQRGGMRTTPGQPYAPVRAEQYFTVDPPGFLWSVDVTMWGIPVVGRDSYTGGHGRMLIRAGGLVTVADGTGPRFDQGTALRFLGEIVWFPSAAAAPYITWTAVDDARAEATLTVGDVRVSALFTFDDAGRFSRLEADRYYNGERLERWEIPATAWQVVRGIEIPVRGGAVWKLASGDFDYYQWEIEDVETNRPALWAEPDS